ncbi:DUF2336 domain-containing protein [Labrenzia sp. 011]|uniref:DUF2336 domain-containing protein n=1 Tax=Labrenzia sp. 011 TaxID=2171494 RepID=UPI000D50C660|nr:DUF2336 domain-containing protein [Labrenzia sp. 011]PVB61077.1 hypothetical protein DCO57_14140 [Labrenzia sp. 011]
MRQRPHVDSSVHTSAHGRKKAPQDGGVLLAATELFVGKSWHDVEEKKIFLELARNLLPATTLQDRRRIASMLAAHPEIPDDLLELLASDEDELTAYPALRYSQRLSVDLLLRKVRSGPDSLRRAIANRPSLRESVLTALCEHAGADVIRVLLQREDVRLAPVHHDKLSRRSEIVAALGLELAGQDALNPDGLMGQYLHLPAPLKAKAIAAAEITSLVDKARTPGSGTLHRRDGRLCDALVARARAGDRPHFAALLNQGLSLSQPVCDQLLQGTQKDGLTIALKALGMSPSQTATVLIRMFGEDMPLSDLRGLLRFHRTLSVGAAGVLTSQWILRDEDTGTASPRHAPQYQETRRPQETARTTSGAAEIGPARQKTGS